MEFFRLDERFEYLFFRLEIGSMAEQSVFVLLEPLFSLDTIAAKVDKIDEHDEQDDDDGDRDGDLDTQCSFTIVISGASD